MYDPPGVGGTHVIYVLHDINHPEALWRLAQGSAGAVVVHIWKGPLKWLGNLAMAAGIIGAALHYVRYGPKTVEKTEPEGSGATAPKEPSTGPKEPFAAPKEPSKR